MTDLDHFREFNVSYGREAGDLRLQQVGEVLRTVVRQSIACRQGGEESVLVMPDSPCADRCRRADKLPVLVRNLTIGHEDRLLGSITVSAGLAVASADGLTTRESLAAADSALYAATSGGRGQLACSRAACGPGSIDLDDAEAQPSAPARLPRTDALQITLIGFTSAARA